ncbi:MAG: 50S ribosomal protein L21, partial [Sphaerochaetaceae bacterium]|nr:50S ribosomal protein L21 [Sphaerochaetaceae bacterium]
MNKDVMDMYALVEILGKQYKAEEGTMLLVDRIDMEAGKELEFDTVVDIADGENSVFGKPYIEGAKVVATLGDIVKGDKIKVFKYHRRKG